MSTSNSTGSEGLNVYSGLGLKTDAFVNVAFLSIAFWTLIEVVYLNFTTFKEWKSLFFLTMTVSTVSQILLNTGTIITLASPNAILAAAISMPGLVLSVPAQFGLLYLRLRLLSPNFRILRVLLIMAVFEQIFIEIPYDVLWLGSIINGSVVWTNTFTIWSQAECIIWSFVDMSFAAAYIMQVRALWSPTADSDRKLVLKQISFMVGAIVVLDTAYIVSTYAAPEEIFYSLMGFAFANKLKVEFWCLRGLKRWSTFHRDATQELSHMETIVVEEETLPSVSSCMPTKYESHNEN